MKGPLSGCVILDCSSLLPGPRVGKLMAEKGARVIKIENPAFPDRANDLGPFYNDLNSKKEKVSLAYSPGEAGREEFEGWVRQANGIIEGFRPNAKLQRGLDSHTLHALNPKLSILSLVGYAEEGPHRDRPGHDMNFQALSGCLSLFHDLPGLPLADLFGAYEGAFALTAAIHEASLGQPGKRICVSLFETLKQVQSSAIAIYRTTGEVPRPGETLFSGKYPCYHIYQAGCGRRVSVGAIEKKFWTQTCQILGLPELIEKGYTTGIEGQNVTSRVQAALSSRPWAAWAALFDSAQCCVEPILEYSEVYPRGL